MFGIDIVVRNSNRKGRLEWSSKEMEDIEKLLNLLEEKLESLTEMLDWEVPEDPGSLFWAKSPVDLVHKLPGTFGRGAAGEIGDRNRLRGWVAESMIINIAQKRGLPNHHVQLLQWWSFTVGIKNPIEFARLADPEKLIEEYWEDQEWAEGVREREEF